ncbi:hypothetical protein PHISP_04528 [Aspergillus sp. HF37]|nr:hypothetical protein PHISP_04528 [Aspergillus sp. HF37]
MLPPAAAFFFFFFVRRGSKLQLHWPDDKTTAQPGNLESYASPPLSPPSLWSVDLDPLRRASSKACLGGMDGDNRRLKQQHHHHHDPAAFATRSAIGRRPVPRSAPDRFRPSAQQQQQTLQPSLPQTTGRPPPPRMPTYADYGYTDPSTLQGGSALQPDELQSYATPEFSPRQQHQRQQSQQQQQNQQLQPPPFTPYEQPEIVYHHAQAPYEVVPQYPGPATGAGAGGRQSASAAAAIEALSTQFAVPQYFQVPPPPPPTEPSWSGVVPPYLTPQQQIPAAYNQPVGGRATASQRFPAGSMADFTSAAARLDQQQQQQSPSHPHPQQQTQHQQPNSESLNVGEACEQFQAALRGTFEHTRAGRLVEASRSLLEISEWLVGNARELGILRDIDDQHHYTSRLTLWNDFNMCWLAVCQKQRDLTHELLQMGGLGPFHHCSPTAGTGLLPLLAPDALEDLGSGLIQLCDKMEQHGLVDYQMGIWEEEILCILTQCLDLMESRPDVLEGHTVAAAAAAGTRS